MSEHLLDQQHDLLVSGDAFPCAGLHVDPQSTDGTVLVRIEGELDMCRAPRLDKVLNTALKDPAPAVVVLDLSELTFIDSTGVRVLISAHRQGRDRGCSLLLRAPNRSVMKVLRLTGLDRLLVIEGAPSDS